MGRSRATMDSPCIGICKIDRETRLCTGCARSLDEIACWSALSDADRSRIMAELPSRAPGPVSRRRRRNRAAAGP